MGTRVELYEAIRRDFRLEDLSIRALAERHGVHRRTVRAALASVPERWAVPTQGLCPCRRLLLGLVLFGRLRYRATAARTGLSAQLVSVLCLTALLKLREATTWETEAVVDSCANVARPTLTLSRA